eukprot:scaffold240240_cov27-Tisochrysis_lutea.AAC.1
MLAPPDQQELLFQPSLAPTSTNWWPGRISLREATRGEREAKAFVEGVTRAGGKGKASSHARGNCYTTTSGKRQKRSGERASNEAMALS